MSQHMHFHFYWDQERVDDSQKKVEQQISKLQAMIRVFDSKTA